MLKDYINDRTGFMNGGLLHNREAVYKYFTVKNLDEVFLGGGDYPSLSQTELDEFAETVIKNKWHMEKSISKMFGIRVSLVDNESIIDTKISRMRKQIKEYQYD